MSWYEEFGFDEDPYKKTDPPLIPFERIRWNREDLADARKALDLFLDDVRGGYKVGLVAFGPVGSGKTWLSRVIETEIPPDLSDVLIIRTKIIRVQPNFSAVYDYFIRNITSPKGIFLPKLKDHLGTDISDWTAFFENADLANALFHLALPDAKKTTSLNWLLNLGVTMTELDKADITAKIGGDAHKYEIMRLIIKKSAEIFSSVILNVDELENASLTFARQISDVLRDLLDEFYEKFVLCCFISLRAESEWYERGYSDYLFSRMDYVINLDAIKPNYAPHFFRLHHEVYRRKDKETEDQLFPFTEDGIKRLVEVMKPERAFPRYIFENCGILARILASEGGKSINSDFVDKHKSRLREIEPPREQMTL